MFRGRIVYASNEPSISPMENLQDYEAIYFGQIYKEIRRSKKLSLKFKAALKDMQDGLLRSDEVNHKKSDSNED